MSDPLSPVTLNFDASTVPPAAAFDPVPAGWYNVKIIESGMKPTADGRGSYLALTMEILDGPHARRKLFDRLNLQNANAVAVEIAYKTLSAICHACKIIQVANSAQLHGIPMMAKVSIRPAGPAKNGQHYDANNEVKGYRPCDGAPQDRKSVV